MKDFREMLTVKELAKALKVHPDTIRNWADHGKIKSYRHPVNNYRLFDLGEIRKDLDLGSEKPLVSD